jgi:hypothetical protein
MTTQEKSEDHSHAANYSISEGISIGAGLAKVEVGKKDVTNGCARDRQGESQHLEEKVCLLRMLRIRIGSGAEAVRVVTASTTRMRKVVQTAVGLTNETHGEVCECFCWKV